MQETSESDRIIAGFGTGPAAIAQARKIDDLVLRANASSRGSTARPLVAIGCSVTPEKAVRENAVEGRAGAGRKLTDRRS